MCVEARLALITESSGYVWSRTLCVLYPLSNLDKPMIFDLTLIEFYIAISDIFHITFSLCKIIFQVRCILMRGKEFSCIIRKYYFYDCLLNKKFLGKGLQWVNLNSSLHPSLLSLWSEAGGFCFSSPFISRPVSLSKKYQKLSKKKASRLL